MAKNTRYDKLKDRVRRRFSCAKTYEPAILEGESELLFDLTNFEASGNDPFLVKGPFNYVSIRNTGPSAVRVYLTSDLETYVDIQAPSGGSAVREATAEIPIRYIGYIRIENLAESTDGSGDIAEGDITLQVGNQVDSVELDLLKMGGMLNVADESEN